jgi:hypothetical protein
MKKKPLADPIIAPEIYQLGEGESGQSRKTAKQAPPKRCAVCGAMSSPQVTPQNPIEEDLCWVCRRLKISAWRESEQISIQE